MIDSKLALRLVLSVFAAGLSFCAAFLFTGAYYKHFVVPKLVEKYPHDGQIGLGGFIGSINVACVVALVVLLIGIAWPFRSPKR